MFARFIFTFLASISFATMGAAQSNTAKVDELFETLNLPQVIDVMRDEGLSYGDVLAQDLFPNRSLDEWHELLAMIYDNDAMMRQVKAGFQSALEDKNIDSALTYFQSEQGQMIIDLEISARRALLDEDVEAIANDQAALAILDETPRYVLVREFVEANDLIEINVVGALNSNYAFMTGLLDGGAFPHDFTEDEILIDVWQQEDGIRSSTTEWAYSFLILAFQPLSDAELETYIAFSESDAGQELNAALFDAFDDTLEGISRDLGLAASRFMTEQEL